MNDGPRISLRLEAWLDEAARERARLSLEEERIRPDQVGPGALKAHYTDAAGKGHSLWVARRGTEFSFDCGCPAPRGQVCEHVFGAVLLAETMGVEGFRRRIVAQRGGEPRAGARPIATSAPAQPATGAPRVAAPARSGRPFVELGGLDGGEARLRLVSWWRRRDGVLANPTPGWASFSDEELGEAGRAAVVEMMKLPALRAPKEDDTRLGARRDSLRSGGIVRLPPEGRAALLQRLCDAELLVREGRIEALRWHPAPVQVELEVEPAPGRADDNAVRVRVNADRARDLRDLDGFSADGLLLARRQLAAIGDPVVATALAELRAHRASALPQSTLRPLLARLFQATDPPRITLPPALRPVESDAVPRPRWTCHPRGRQWTGALAFLYGSQVVEPDNPRPLLFDESAWTLVRRDLRAEQQAQARLERLQDEAAGKEGLIDDEALPGLLRALSAAGFELWRRDRRVRGPAGRDLEVRRGVDWFELDGVQHFEDGGSQRIRDLVERWSSGEGLVELEDGSLGLLPVELEPEQASSEDPLRFGREQALLLEHALERLGTEGGALRLDEASSAAREALHAARRPERQAPGPHFVGELRAYQEEGLGWLQRLAAGELGGILADDMGLGKTVQLLAHLDRRIEADAGPSLVVAPRSVVHQWAAEAARFSPRLRTVVHVGPTRERDRPAWRCGDLVVTTYGILLRDVELLAAIAWDLVVLDEAQAVKNRGTGAARAARRLPARQRLAVTGTPVENHLRELVTHLDFVQPGLFPTARARDRLGRAASPEDAAALGRAIRPLLLRRTKAEVATELPARIEQDLLCELAEEPRRRYDELRRELARELGKRGAETKGKGKLQVLQALLRLRQAACHPGLLDPADADRGSAKFELLLPRLEELIDEGSKALIFSQFTSHLDLLQAELERRAMPFERLDGSTRDRAARVQRFQEDPALPLFLISLKAGGVGLNLTAAQYVFLLDPWWNPAVEAQAIDRAHRRGQQRSVVAYRLLARGTVEEKIRLMQQEKAALAEAALDESGLGEWDFEDLRALLD